MQTIELEIPNYVTNDGFKLSWEDGYVIDVQTDSKVVHIKANEAGLLSLAKIFMTLRDSNVPTHYHIHLDESNSLEDGSNEFIIEKI